MPVLHKAHDKFAWSIPLASLKLKIRKVVKFIKGFLQH